MGTFNDGDSGSSIRTKINTAIQKTEGTSAISTIDVDGGAIDGVTLGTNSAVTEAQVDNININGNAITSTDTNGNIALTPNGTGEVDISKVDIDSGAIDGVTLGTNSAVTEAQVDNININGNTISSTDTNGDVTIDPNGTGDVNIGNFKFDADQTVGAGQDNYVLTYDNAGGKISLEAAAGGGGGGATDIDGLTDGYSDGSSVGLGSGALANDDGTSNTNTAVGILAMNSNTSGSGNTANGREALYSNTTSSNNTAIGTYALYTNTGGDNTATGKNALLSNTSGTSSTANGYKALQNNTSGINNTANGRDSLFGNTTGSNNTANGREALKNNTTGSGNFGAAFLNSSGSYAPVFNPTTENNRIVMGHTSVTNAYVQVAWTVVSDARDKTEIAPLDKGLDFIEQLNPVSYKFRKDRDTEEANGKKRYGFLAQDILEVEGDDNVIVDTEDPDKLKMTHEELIPILVNAVKEQQQQINSLKAEIEILKGN